MKPATLEWRAALQAGPPGGLAVLQPASGPLAARRIARALLEEAAVLGGGRVLCLAGGDLLLGSTPAPGQRAAQAIAGLTGRAPGCWSLPDQRIEAESACDAAHLAAPAPGWSIAALEAHCAARPASEVAQLTLFAEGVGSTPVAQRLSPAPLPVDDPELAAMGREWFCRRLLTALTNPAERHLLPALRPGLRLILDLPLGGLPPGGALRGGAADDPNGPIALLPLASLADPVAFARTANGLRQSGWTVGLLANDPEALGWVTMPGILWATPATALPPAPLPARLLALGAVVPAWCRAPGILHQGVA